MNRRPHEVRGQHSENLAMERTWAASAQGQVKDKEVKWEIVVSCGCGEFGFYCYGAARDYQKKKKLKILI